MEDMLHHLGAGRRRCQSRTADKIAVSKANTLEPSQLSIGDQGYLSPEFRDFPVTLVIWREPGGFPESPTPIERP